MSKLIEDLKESLNILEHFLPSVDQAISTVNQRIQEVNRFQLLWRSSLRDNL